MGRLNLSTDWRDDFDRKLLTPEQAAATINSGDHIWVPPGHASPPILEAIAKRGGELRKVEIRGIGLFDAGWYTGEAAEAFQIASQFGTIVEREALNARTADFHPYWLVGIHKALDAGRDDGEAWRLDKLVLVVSPPNDEGYVSLGGNVWDGVTSARRANTVLAEMNPQVVETFGDTRLHVTEIDSFVAMDRPVFFPRQKIEPDAADEGIAHYVSTLVKNGDTIQIGVGTPTGALTKLGAFDKHEELSYFGELTVEGCVGLAERGVITGRGSRLHPDKFVATMIGNNDEERRIIHRNPRYELHSIEYLLDPRVIAKNEGIVAINGALTLDLSGQVGVYTIGTYIQAGVGGHLAFALGA